MKTKFLFGLALFLSSYLSSRAQPGLPYVESLDAMVAKVPFIVRGYFSNDTRTITSQAGLFKYTLIFHVDEVIKGHPPEPVELTADNVHSYETNEINQLIGRQTTFLYFINTNTFTYFFRPLVRLDGMFSPYSKFFVQPPITLMDSTWLTNPADILSCTRKIAKQRLNSTNTLWLDCGWYHLDVPVTPALEKRAQQLLRSNDWPSLKEGIQALDCFKSANNIWLLRPLLKSTNYSTASFANRPWMSQRVYYQRKAAYDVLTNWGVDVSEPVWKEDLPWRYDPNTRQPLQVQIPFNLSADRIGPLGDNIGIGADFRTDAWTNLLVGSNMITGTRIEWFVYPDGQPKPSKPTRIQQYYQPTPPLDYFNKGRGDNLPEVGKKYIVEMNYILFETDNAPTNHDQLDQIRTDIWRPQDGENYRVLVQKTLSTTCGP